MNGASGSGSGRACSRPSRTRSTPSPSPPRLDPLRSPGLTIVAGAEVYADQVDSWRVDSDATAGIVGHRCAACSPTTPGRSPRPASASRPTERAGSARTLGARYTWTSVTAGDPVFGDVDVSPGAWVGSGALAFELAKGVSAYGSVSQGFRAPNLDDLSTLGLFDFGVEVPAGRASAGALAEHGGRSEAARCPRRRGAGGVPHQPVGPDRSAEGAGPAHRAAVPGRGPVLPAGERRRGVHSRHRGRGRVAHLPDDDAVRSRGVRVRPEHDGRRADAPHPASQRPAGPAVRGLRRLVAPGVAAGGQPAGSTGVRRPRRSPDPVRRNSRLAGSGRLRGACRSAGASRCRSAR